MSDSQHVSYGVRRSKLKEAMKTYSQTCNCFVLSFISMTLQIASSVTPHSNPTQALTKKTGKNAVIFIQTQHYLLDKSLCPCTFNLCLSTLFLVINRKIKILCPTVLLGSLMTQMCTATRAL